MGRTTWRCEIGVVLILGHQHPHACLMQFEWFSEELAVFPGFSVGSWLERCVIFGENGKVGTAVLFNPTVFILNSYTHILHLLMSLPSLWGMSTSSFICSPCVWILASSAFCLCSHYISLRNFYQFFFFA